MEPNTMPDYLAHVNIGLWKADVNQQRFNQFVAIGTQIGMQMLKRYAWVTATNWC